jgi:hypothetical protein
MAEAESVSGSTPGEGPFQLDDQQLHHIAIDF